jgi:hypothetical protein
MERKKYLTDFKMKEAPFVVKRRESIQGLTW